jgi:hypothetical protein
MLKRGNISLERLDIRCEHCFSAIILTKVSNPDLEICNVERHVSPFPISYG